MKNSQTNTINSPNPYFIDSLLENFLDKLANSKKHLGLILITSLYLSILIFFHLNRQFLKNCHFIYATGFIFNFFKFPIKGLRNLCSSAKVKGGARWLQSADTSPVLGNFEQPPHPPPLKFANLGIKIFIYMKKILSLLLK